MARWRLNFTSSDVMSLPSWNFTPFRRWNVQRLWSAELSHLLASPPAPTTLAGYDDALSQKRRAHERRVTSTDSRRSSAGFAGAIGSWGRHRRGPPRPPPSF